jgi:hypothetical protein
MTTVDAERVSRSVGVLNPKREAHTILELVEASGCLTKGIKGLGL